MSRITRAEWGYAAKFGAAVMALTCLPYLLAWGLTPESHVFQGLMYNSDDQSVYLSWMRQARDGHLFLRNLFTTEEQFGRSFHLYFWLLGTLCRVIPISLVAMMHVGRVVFGALALALVYRLGAFFTAEIAQRRLILWVTSFSAGLGWIELLKRPGQAAPEIWSNLQPLDFWQTEMFTFPSLYVNGVYPVSFVLMLGVLIGLLLAEERRQVRYAIAAGVAGLLLGNIHSYDTIILAAVWAAYLICRLAVKRVGWGFVLGASLLAAAIALPAVLYQYGIYQNDPIFAARAEVKTLSRPLGAMFWGYGLLIPLAAVGLVRWPWKTIREQPRLLLIPVWAVVGFGVCYLPLAFQRKLSMGLHFPVAILAAFGVVWLADWLVVIAPGLSRRWVHIAVIVLLAPTLPLWFSRDLGRAVSVNKTSTMLHDVWWPQDTVAAWRWLDENLGPEDVVYGYPLRAVMLPQATGKPTPAGHWGETPEFAEQVRRGQAFFQGRMSFEEAEAYLRARRVTHVLVTETSLQMAAATGPLLRDVRRDPYLHQVWRSDTAAVYELIDTR